MKLSLLFFIIIVVSSCNSKYKIHQQYLSDSYEKSIDTVVFVPYRQGDKWFYVDRRTKGPYAGHAKAFEGEWSRAYPFNPYNLALVSKDGLYGYINKTGKIVIPIIYNHSDPDKVSEGLIVLTAAENGEYYKGAVNLKGDTTIPFKYMEVSKSVNNKLVARYSNKAVELLDTKGNILIDSGKYVNIAHDVNAQDGVIVATLNKRAHCFIDSSLKNKTDLDVEGFFRFRSNLAKTVKDNHFGYINSEGQTVIPFKYISASDFHRGVATVENEDWYCGVIDTTGNVVIPFVYSLLGKKGFEKGLIPAVKDENWGVINKKNEKVLNFIYEDMDIYYYKYGLFCVEHKQGWGMVDASGNFIIPPVYGDSPFPPVAVTPSRIIVNKGQERWGIINRKNEIIAPLKYYSIGNDMNELLYRLRDELIFMKDGLIEVVTNTEEGMKEGYIDIWGKEYFED